MQEILEEDVLLRQMDESPRSEQGSMHVFQVQAQVWASKKKKEMRLELPKMRFHIIGF